jgi:hypothetical protein
VLDKFLTGEGILESDLIDRLAALLGCKLCQKVLQEGERPSATSA